MDIEVLGASFKYAQFKLIEVKEKYYLVDPISNISIDLESGIVGLKEIEAETQRDWLLKAIAAVIGKIALGNLAAIVGALVFGNDKYTVYEITLDNNDTLLVKADEDMSDMLNSSYQKRCFGERQGNYAYGS